MHANVRCSNDRPLNKNVGTRSSYLVAIVVVMMMVRGETKEDRIAAIAGTCCVCVCACACARGEGRERDQIRTTTPPFESTALFRNTMNLFKARNASISTPGSVGGP